MKIIKWLFIIVLVGSYPACSWDAHLSNYLFEQYCNEEGRIGQFIYERVGLGEEYFIPIPKDERELIRVDNGFLIDEGRLLIDKQRFLRDFTINTMEETMLSSIGPIYSYETTVVRKYDGKILSKAISLRNNQGWFANYQNSIFPNEGDSCPKGRDNKGYSLFNKSHYTLIKKTFITNF